MLCSIKGKGYEQALWRLPTCALIIKLLMSLREHTVSRRKDYGSFLQNGLLDIELITLGLLVQKTTADKHRSAMENLAERIEDMKISEVLTETWTIRKFHQEKERAWDAGVSMLRNLYTTHTEDLPSGNGKLIRFTVLLIIEHEKFVRDKPNAKLEMDTLNLTVEHILPQVGGGVCASGQQMTGPTLCSQLYSAGSHPNPCAVAISGDSTRRFGITE